MSIDMTSIHQAFFEEAGDLLNDFENQLLFLEGSPSDKETLNSIFRCAHSIKGGSATFGFPDVAQFTHSLETLLDGVRNGHVPVTKPLCSLLLESLDQMRELLAVAKGDSPFAPDSTQLISRIELASEFDKSQSDPQSAPNEVWGLFGSPEIFELTFSPSAEAFKSGFDPMAVIEELSKIGEILRLDCNTSKLPSLEDMDPTTNYLAWNVAFYSSASKERILELFGEAPEGSMMDLVQMGGGDIDSPELSTSEPKTPESKPTKATAETSSGTQTSSKDSGTIKVSSEKLDTLINLVGELIISQSMLNSVTQDFDITKVPQLEEAVAAMERSSRELQERVMAIRLLQIKMAFGRFPRLVHDLSSKVGKTIELKLSGEETELDKNLIEAIGDPLTHLVRNSIDHGLESPEDREAVGKPRTGILSISAFHEGGSIVIEVSDDGKGLNRDRILEKAVERGLVQSEEALSDEQIYNLIFLPGFSTAEQVTDLSGRGVGMDIVKQAILSIGGTIKVSSTPGQGVSTRIRLPLTMAILEGQSMSVGDGVYIVPLTSIVESIRPKESDLHNVAQLGEVVTVRGEYLPVIRLYETFNLDPLTINPWEASLVLVEADGKKVALMADDLIGQGQVVIKSLETNYQKVDGIAGATILGDGRVALIIDVPGLLRGIAGRSGAQLTTAAGSQWQ